MIGLIGGSGFEELLEERKPEIIKTPYGLVEAYEGRVRDVSVLFIPRHGRKHEFPPHRVNYRANIFALRRKGVLKVVSTSAVGAINPDLKPGDLVLPDQFLDFTKGRPYTFYDDLVVHVDVSRPYSSKLRSILEGAARRLGLKVRNGATYVATEGPRFETPAEISAYRLLGGDIVGMTGIPEVILARELGLCYATIAIVTNYAAGLQERLSQEEVFEVTKRAESSVKELLEESAKEIDECERDEDCKLMDPFVEELFSRFSDL